MKTGIRGAIALALFVAVSAGSAGSAPLLRHRLADVEPATSKIDARLPCDASGMGLGSCPSPNARCHEYCDDEYYIDNLECMAGKEGILDWQRAICHGKATVKMGRCHAQCNRDYPI